jgi:PAS domain S-box-containing protein
MRNYKILTQNTKNLYLQHMLSKKWFDLLLLILAAFISNLFPVPLFFGVDFLFGSIFVFVALHHLGLKAGIIVALSSSAYTIILWGHPYAFIIFLSEAIIVGYLYKKFNSLLIACCIFWAFIGAPLILVFYAAVMGMDTLSWKLILIKQTLNGVFNVVIALLLIHIFCIKGCNNKLVSLTLERSIRWFSMVTVLVPLFILMEVQSYNAYSKMTEKSIDFIEHVYNGELKYITQDIKGKVLTIKDTLFELSLDENVISFFENKNNQLLSDSITSSLDLFEHVILVNSDGLIVSTYSPGDAGFDKQWIETDLSFLPYTKSVLNKENLYINGFYVGMHNNSFVSVTSPIIRKGQNKALLVGVFKKEYLSSILNQVVQGSDEIILEIIDSNSNVITSNDKQPQSSRDVFLGWADTPLDNYPAINHFMIKDESTSLMFRWRESFLKKEIMVSEIYSLKIKLLIPLKKNVDGLRDDYITLLLTIFGLLIMAMIIATYFARKIVKPFVEITKITKYDDIRLSSEKINWPQSNIQETTSLIDTLKNNRQVISNTIEALTKKNIENEVITKSLKVSQQSLNNILTNIKECIVTCNAEGIIKSVNKSTYMTFGYEHDTLIGENIFLLIPQDFFDSNIGVLPAYVKPVDSLLNKLNDFNSSLPLLERLSKSDMGRYENGCLFPIEISVTVTDKTQDKLLIAVIRDISAKVENKIAQKALSQRMKMFFSVGTEGIIFHDNGTILDINENGAKTLGYGIKELIGRKVNDFISPGAKFNYLSDSKDTWEVDVLCKDGTSLLIEVKDGGQSFDDTRYLSFSNIEARKEFENEFSQIAKDLTILIDTANAPIFGIDNQGKVNEWNQKSAEITGFKSDEVLGKDLVEEFITQDYRQSVNEVLQKALHGDETSNYEFPLYTKDNDLVMVLLNATTRRNANGDVVGVVGVGQDITELDSYRSEMETIVKDRTRDLDSISRLSPDGYVLVNADNKIVHINPAFLDMMGFKKDLFINQSAEILSDAMARIYGSDNIKTINSFGNEDGELVIHLSHPRHRIINCIQKTMYGLAGRKEGRVLYFRDVTHETEVDRMKSEFLSTAAHELRTPLASIYGFSELLLARNYDKKMSSEMIETIHRQSFNLKRLLDELLDLSRIEARAGKDFYMENSSIEHIVKESCNEVEGAFKGRKVDVQPLVDWQILSFDKDKMRQVFINLLSNGFKYSPDNKNILLTTSERENNGIKQFGISIIDNGIGVTTQQLSRLGERFYRADDSGATPGTGLGLSLVKEIILIHGGETEFTSIKEKGMTATVWLPVIINQSNEE